MKIKWEKLSEKRYKSGYRKMIRRKYKLPNGKIADYAIVDNGKAVCAVALTKEKKVILLKIYRPGPDKILLELPGGLIESEDTPEKAIRREFLEETGYTGDFELVSTTYEDAYSTMIRYNFVSQNCEKVQEPELEDDEGGAETILLSIDEFKRHLKSGELTDPETGHIGLLHLNLL